MLILKIKENWQMFKEKFIQHRKKALFLFAFSLLSTIGGINYVKQLNQAEFENKQVLNIGNYYNQLMDINEDKPYLVIENLLLNTLLVSKDHINMEDFKEFIQNDDGKIWSEILENEQKKIFLKQSYKMASFILYNLSKDIPDSVIKKSIIDNALNKYNLLERIDKNLNEQKLNVAEAMIAKDIVLSPFKQLSSFEPIKKDLKKESNSYNEQEFKIKF